MADDATMVLEGLDQAVRELYECVPAIRDRVLKGMCATGASVFRQAAIGFAPEWQEAVSKGHPPGGTLKRAIYQARFVNKCTSTDEVWFVDVRKGKKFRFAGRNTSAAGPVQVGQDAFYAGWIEFGHYTHVPMAMTKTAKAAGRALGVATYVAPQPFMRKAFETKNEAASAAMFDYVRQKLPLALGFNTYLKAA